MTVLFDTSVLVAALVRKHPEHDRAVGWLRRAKSREIQGSISTHSLAELYAVLTALPLSPRISVGAAQRLIRENIWDHFEPIALTAEDYWLTIGSCVELGRQSGAVYDGLIARCAQKTSVDRLLTANCVHFRELWPEAADKVIEP